MTVFVTGGTGFVGSYVVPLLVKSGYNVRCLVRNLENDLPDYGESVEFVQGDVTRATGLTDSMRGCDAVIHLVGIIEEHPRRGVTFDNVHAVGTRNVVHAAVETGIGTFVHMSANGAREDGVSKYQTSKWAGEESVRAARFKSATIFRPSLVFGRAMGEHPEFVSDLVDQLIEPFPILPIFGDGKFALSPVAAQSVAKAFVLSVGIEEPGYREYVAAGPDTLSYVEIVDLITEATGSNIKPKIHLPVELLRFGIGLLGWTGLLPITRDQLDMLTEGNSGSSEPFHNDFSLDPVPFSKQTLDYVLES
jgi:nucleoside-diphosphate-sugar epimerase